MLLLYLSHLREIQLEYQWKQPKVAMLDDLFLYDYRDVKYDGWHPAAHPKNALVNSMQVTDITPLMENAIVKHMCADDFKIPCL